MGKSGLGYVVVQLVGVLPARLSSACRHIPRCISYVANIATISVTSGSRIELAKWILESAGYEQPRHVNAVIDGNQMRCDTSWLSLQPLPNGRCSKLRFGLFKKGHIRSQGSSDTKKGLLCLVEPISAPAIE